MQRLWTAPAVLTLLGLLAWGQYLLFVPRPTACERPREELVLRLDKLLEGGARRPTTGEAYDGWTVTLSRVGDDDIRLRSCRADEQGPPDCYEQHFARSFGRVLLGSGK